VRVGHRAIVVAAGEQGDFTTELTHDDFSYSPPQVNRLGRGAAKARVGSVDGSGVHFCLETVLDRLSGRNSRTKILDQFLDRLLRYVAPEILDLGLGENRNKRSDHSRGRFQRTVTGTSIPGIEFPIQALDLSLRLFQFGLGLLQGNGFVMPRSVRLE
jgi:hypothetical protein